MPAGVPPQWKEEPPRGTMAARAELPGAVHGSRSQRSRSACPGRAPGLRRCVQPETHKEPSGSLSLPLCLSLSRSPSLCLSQGIRLWVVSFSLLAPSYFQVLFLLPGNSCAQVYCRARALSRGHVWRRDLKNHGANSSTLLTVIPPASTHSDQ